MRAVRITKAGGPEVLTVTDHPVRAAGAGEVRIAVKAAAVNPTDILMRENPEVYAKGSPGIPGMDAAGLIESVGGGVERLKVGDEVMAVVTPRRPEGGAQIELLVVPAASVVQIPSGATLAQASTLPMNGLTARLALDLIKLSAGQTLAVSGGAYVPVRGWDGSPSERDVRIQPVMVMEALTRTDWLTELRDLASSGAITLRVAGEYPPERAADAHRAMEAGGLRGRGIIVF